MPKGQCVEGPAPGKNAVEFLGFLAQLTYEYRDRHCIVVLDNTSYHTACVVQFRNSCVSYLVVSM